MSKNNLVVLAAVGAVAFIVYQKQKSGQSILPRTPTTPAVPSRNVNGDMWAAILGAGAWRNLLGGATNNGTQAFTMTDGYGRVTTSDGVPVGSGDYLDDWISANTGLPATYTENVANPSLLEELGFSGGVRTPGSFQDSIGQNTYGWGQQ